MSRPTTRIYLDYNATAPLRPCARAAMRDAMERPAGNPSSPHAEGRLAHALLDDARQQVAGLVGAPAERVVLTSGGTESVNAMMRGVVAAAPADSRRLLVAATDHACVLATAQALEAEGAAVACVPVQASGAIDLDALEEALHGGAAGLATHWANNETGVLQDVQELGALCARYGVPLLLDAVQAAGKVPVDFSTSGAAALALSGHKLGGPAGVGALVLSDHLAWQSLLQGGHQEHDRRAGTEPVIGAVGFGAAAEAAAAEVDTYAARVGPLRDALLEHVRAHIPDVVTHGEGAPRVANTLNMRVPGWSAETLVQRLDLEGIAAGTGAACAAGAAEPSHVLMAMGLTQAEAGEAVRFSLGYETTAEEIAGVGAVVAALAAEWGRPIGARSEG